MGERPDARVVERSDAVVRVVVACVCGSDLWYYRGQSPYQVGDPIGHEFVGVVEAVGSDVQRLSIGDFVVCPFAFSDGTCPNCQHDMMTACQHGGFIPAGNGDGGQGEAVRVPHADATLVRVSGEVASGAMLASLLTLTDVMGTGHHAAVCARVKAGDTVAVVGDGAVGLCGVLAARRMGAERIIALSRHPERQAVAKTFGATEIVDTRGDEAVTDVVDLTGGIGVDATLECVGTAEAMAAALGIARPGSMVGYVGLPHGIEFPVMDMFGRNIGVQGGPAPVRAYIPDLLGDVLNGAINPGIVFDFTTDLDHIADAYAAMDQRRAIKSLISVSNP